MRNVRTLREDTTADPWQQYRIERVDDGKVIGRMRHRKGNPADEWQLDLGDLAWWEHFPEMAGPVAQKLHPFKEAVLILTAYQDALERRPRRSTP